MTGLSSEAGVLKSFVDDEAESRHVDDDEEEIRHISDDEEGVRRDDDLSCKSWNGDKDVTPVSFSCFRCRASIVSYESFAAVDEVYEAVNGKPLCRSCRAMDRYAHRSQFDGRSALVIHSSMALNQSRVGLLETFPTDIGSCTLCKN